MTTVSDIQPIKITDVPTLAALHAEGFADTVQEPWKAEAIAALLILPGTFGFRFGALGFVLARSAADECEILTVAVAGDARRGGVGRALMARVLDEARVRGAATLHLEVGETNAAARALYAALGFHETGRRKNYYGGREDALLMALAL